MVSIQVLQATIDGMRNITRRDISIIEREGKIVASTEEKLLNSQLSGIEDFVNSQAESQLIQGYQYFKVFDNGIGEYVIMINGEDEEAYRVGKITAFQITGLIIAYKERYDKDNFIKNLLLDNLLLVDIYGRAKKLHVENNVRRIVYLIETEIDKDMSVVEIVRNMFPFKAKDFVTAVDEHNIILVKELAERDTIEEIEHIAHKIHDTLLSETFNNVFVSIGTVVTDLKNVSASYKEAMMALEVGKIFDPGKNIINYEKLGIGRLIYQLPSPLCRMFISEVLGGLTLSQFEEETLTTVHKFFENNLNVSETARQLYIHRNTLVYRLDKIQRLTGMDLRKFDDAITFKITLMVNKYMSFKDRFMY